MEWPISQAPVSQSEIDALPTTCSTEQLEQIHSDEPDFTLTPPDSVKLTVLVIGGKEPLSPTFIPGAMTSGIQRELATHIAIELNRSLLRHKDLHNWHLVAYGKGMSGKGFCVVRVHLPAGWKPRTEYDTPPSADCGMMNAEARMSAVRFNRMQLRSGGPVKFWQLHIKPLEFPKAAVRDELNELEAELIARAAEGLGGHVHVNRARNGELSLQFNGELNSVRWSSETEDVSALARHFRSLARRFTQAANAVEGRPMTPATLHIIQENERLIRIEGFDDVHLLVENAKNDETAFSRAREALSLIAG